MEQPSVVGVTGDKKIAKVTLFGVPDRPGIAAEIFKDLADREILIRLIIQSAANEAVARITFIVDDEVADRARDLILVWKGKGIAKDGLVEGHMAKIAIVGSRLSSTSRLSALSNRRAKFTSHAGILLSQPWRCSAAPGSPANWPPKPPQNSSQRRSPTFRSRSNSRSAAAPVVSRISTAPWP